MILAQPAWLLLLFPVGLLWFRRRYPSPSLNVLRAAFFLLIIFGLARPMLRLPDRSGMVVVVADRSRSMPPDSGPGQKEAIDMIQAAMDDDDLLGVVCFGQRVAVEQPPQRGKFAGFVSEVGPHQSDLGAAIQRALSLIPNDGAGRIVVFSDGRWTGVDPAGVAAAAASRDIAIDYRLQERLPVGDVAIRRLDVPDTVMPGEAFMLTAWIDSPVSCRTEYRLMQDSRIVAHGQSRLNAGLNRLIFRDRAGRSGNRAYRLILNAADEDSIPENNRAKALVGIDGPRPILCVSPEGSGLPALLGEGGVNIEPRRAEDCRWRLEDMADYSAVLIENVGANEIGTEGMENLAAWITESGGGLMMTGGRRGYGPGGYFRSPLDPLLPVSMELRKEHRKFSMAIVVAMDRSGSMSMSAGGGRTKMDLANAGAVQVLDLLSENDSFGVIAVDSTAHPVVKLKPVQEAQAHRGEVLSIESMGGGIFVYEALKASARMLLDCQAGTRHIILFADAADSEKPGDYIALLEKCSNAGITVSVVGLGTPGDPDAHLLRDIASRGKGQCFFTQDPNEVPRLFAQDTFAVARSSLVEEQTPVILTPLYATLTGSRLGDMPDVGGYNLCYIRPDADLAGVTRDEYKAPLVAAWHAGSGRALCYTGQADGKFTGPVAKWKRFGDFLTSLVRWTAGHDRDLPGEMMLVQSLRGGVCRVELHLDPERIKDSFVGTPLLKALRERNSGPPVSESVRMQWGSADRMVGEFRLNGPQTALPTVDIPGMEPVMLKPVCLPYSPEFQPVQSGVGRDTMQSLARVTGGRARLNLADVWHDLPRTQRLADVGRWFYLAAVCVLLAEVFERRTGRMKLRRIRMPLLAGLMRHVQMPHRRRKPDSKSAQSMDSQEELPEQEDQGRVSEQEKEESSHSTLDAMKKARKASERRNRRR